MTILLQDYEGDKMSQITVDEVDGSSSRRKNSTALIVDTFFKLSFLKVLIVDIGISIGKMSHNDPEYIVLQATLSQTACKASI